MLSYLLTAPTAEPVTVDDAKLAARLDGAHWDAIVGPNIEAARVVAEHETGRRLMTQTWRYELEDWPTADELIPELAPTAVVINYWTGSAWLQLGTPSFVWQPAGTGRASIALAPAFGTSWPALGSVALGPRVQVDVTTGAANASGVPAPAKSFIKALNAVMVGDPTLSAADAAGQHRYLARILDPIRLYR